jgi:replicative DNA helicase
MDSISEIIHTPHDVGMAGYEATKRAIEFGDIGIPLSIGGSDLSEYFAPLLPQEVCAIQAQTHNGKTFFTDWWERESVKYLASKSLEGDLIHVSLEESLETISFNEYGRLLDIIPSKLARGEFKDISRLEIAMKQIDGSRIWRIADSAGNNKEVELTLTNIHRALVAMQEGEITDKRKIRLITVDYLQALPIDSEMKKAEYKDQRRLQVRADVYRLRNMAKSMFVPILVPVQCKQALTGAKHPYLIPGMYDGEETSSIAQRFDRIISLWMPKNDYPVGVPVFSGEKGNKILEFVPEENQVFLKVNKQRGGLPSSKTFELRMDFMKREYVSKYGKPVAEKQ